MIYDKVLDMMKDLKTCHVKVYDTNNKRIYDCVDETSVENTIDKLNNCLPQLQSYGKVIFHAATEGIKKQNWKDCYVWPVTFNGVATNTSNENQHQNNNFRQPNGFISQNEATLMAQVKAMEIQMQFQKQIDAINLRLLDQNKESPYEKFLPLIGLIPGFEITDEKIGGMMKLAQIQGMTKGNQMQPIQTPTAIAGVNTGVQSESGAKIELTEEEKKQVEIFNAEIDKLSEKSSMEKLTALVQALNNNPAYIDMALTFMNNNKK